MKEIVRLYTLWGKELISIQRKYIKKIKKILQRQYKAVLKELETNPSILINDLLVDQKQFIEKYEDDEDGLETYTNMISDWFKEWAEQLDSSFKIDPRIDVSFGIKDEEALNFARLHAAEKVTRIDEYTRKRINNLVTKWIEEWRWYNKIKAELKKDYSFSDYRSRLIAAQEVWMAYLDWKQKQFEKYRSRFNENWFKKRNTQKDDKVTKWCYENWSVWWIPFDELFPSWHEKPTRFPWCRCNVSYRLFNPDDDSEELDEAIDDEQNFDDDWFDEWIKPINYDKISTKQIPAEYFNAIWHKWFKYMAKGSWYYSSAENIINIWWKIRKGIALWIEKRIQTEFHEVWHAFFDKVILKNEKYKESFISMFLESQEELKEILNNKDVYDILTYSKFTDRTCIHLYEIDKIKKIKWYEIIKRFYKEKWMMISYYSWNDKLENDVWGLFDTIQALSNSRYGFWHKSWYYWNGYKILYNNWKSIISSNQWHEYFAHLNEVYYLWNDLMKIFMPKTYGNMKKYYKSIWFNFKN